MCPSFNLISEPWIPVLLATGERTELGLREVLAQAHEIREIQDDSPLVTAALHRLLLAVLHRVFGPPDLKSWVALWKQKCFEQAPLEDYWTRWGDRFDLFHPERPFFQQAGLKTKAPSPAFRMAQEFACGNNDTLFDHHCEDIETAYPLPQVARWLVCVQGYAFSGRLESGYPLAGNLVKGAMVLLTGINLWETLVLNMICYRPGSDVPIPSTPGDLPVWESDHQAQYMKRVPEGYLDYLTWQSRAIRLIPDEGQTVTRINFDGGFMIPDSVTVLDPFFSYLRDEDTEGWAALAFREHKALWRDSGVLFELTDTKRRPPDSFRQLARAIDKGYVDWQQRYNLSLIGLCSNKAKVNFWRHERLPLPLTYLEDPALVGFLQVALKWTENTGRALRSALWVLSKSLLAPIEQGDGKRDPDTKVVSKLADSFPSERQFWALLEVPFHELFLALPGDSDAARRRWCAVLQRTARSALALATDALDGSARSLKAAVAARSALERALHDEQVLPQYTKEEVTADAE